MSELPLIMGPEEWAPLLRCTARTVEDNLRAGNLPGVKVGEGWVCPTEAMVRRLNEMAWEKMLERREGQRKQAGFVQVGQPEGRRPPALQ